MDYCKLCKTEIANQENSHIIPKFFRKRISSLPYKLMLATLDGETTLEQDIPKQSFILCSICEKKFNVQETDFANLIVKLIDNYPSYPNAFNQLYINGQEYLQCKKLKPVILKLFLYSIIWRCSISSLESFNNFKLPIKVEEEIRRYLFSYSGTKLNYNTNILEILDNQPDYHLVLIKSKIKTNEILAAANFGQTAHIIFMGDFLLFFYTTELPIIPGHENYSNKQNENAIIVIGSTEKWQTLTNLIIDKFIK